MAKTSMTAQPANTNPTGALTSNRLNTSAVQAEMSQPRVAEARALEVAMREPASAILCTSLGRAQAAFHLAQTMHASQVVCWFLDVYRQQLANQTLAQHPPVANLTTLCHADFSQQSFDLAVLPCSVQGEAELTRDLLQTAYQRLSDGGRLVTAVDHATDRWLAEQVESLGGKVERCAFADAVAYQVRKTRPLKRPRNFTCHFKFRDGDHLIEAVTRPGVFSHRHLDPGARRLLEFAEVTDGDRVLDIGCGCGAVGIGLALRGPRIRVHAVDSNARAVECTLLGAKLNGIADRVTVELNGSGIVSDELFDCIVANPPYYADFRIAEHFIGIAEQFIKPRGRFVIVTKTPQWYEERLIRRWRHVSTVEAKQYYVVKLVAIEQPR